MKNLIRLGFASLLLASVVAWPGTASAYPWDCGPINNNSTCHAGCECDFEECTLQPCGQACWRDCFRNQVACDLDCNSFFTN